VGKGEVFFKTEGVKVQIAVERRTILLGEIRSDIARERDKLNQGLRRTERWMGIAERRKRGD